MSAPPSSISSPVSSPLTARPGATDAARLDVLRAESLTVGYARGRGASQVIARDLDLGLAPGELVCLIGPNGTGKSTLMRTLAGMLPPLAGRVVLGDVDLSAMSAAERARQLAVVLTDRPGIGLLNGYALVALGRHPHSDWLGRLSPRDEAIVRWAIAAVGATDLADRPVMTLSDGQRQKLMIARALAQEPRAILLDEPTAFLDLPRRVELMALLRAITRETGRAVLLSTHELDLALRTADRLWLLAGGRLWAGAPEDLALSGAIGAAFQAEGVDFDPATGAFTRAEKSGRAIALVGDGLAAIWTRRALERAGFALVDASGEGAAIRVEIVEREGRPAWRLVQPGVLTEIDSISALLEALGHD
jgi:iron complex transport system ATP-binding protein